MSEKPFNALAQQRKALVHRRAFKGRRFRHYKGDIYVVTDVTVREKDGVVEVHYQSTSAFVDGEPYQWTRTLRNFTSRVRGVDRFKLLFGLEDT